ncbi:secreted RxLR effector protein 161-like [Silene latifolia]|uniref:secreted RxLR effector protein 161-like n=1 Tax=Silene latifolia TaxID=37657 RepID=UPI003D7761E9
MENATVSEFPMPRGLKLSTDTGDLLEEPEKYRRLVGRLLYLNMTRPDISYSVQHLSQFVSQPRMPHMQAAIHVLKYLKKTVNTGLFYSANSDLRLNAFTDADWGQCAYSCKSLSGYCVFLGQSLISWKTKKQRTVSKSSAESEYRSMSYTTSELVWLDNLLQDFRIIVPKPIPLNCDNKAAQHISQNPVFHERTKHLSIDCHYVRDKQDEGFLITKHVRTGLQLADIMTKALGAEQHRFLSSKLGLIPTQNPA